MVESGWVVLLPYLLSTVHICRSFELGGEDLAWPGSTWDGLAVGYGHPGWELPLADPSAALLPLAEFPAPLETAVVHNHYHHIVGGAGPYGGHGAPPQEGLINDPLYQHFPAGHHHPHHQGGHHHPTRDWYCHHAKKVKHLKKWLVKMLFCNLVY